MQKAGGMHGHAYVLVDRVRLLRHAGLVADSVRDLLFSGQRGQQALAPRDQSE